MKFSQPFKGVIDGDVLPTDFEAGDDCPPELEEGARVMGSLDEDDDGAAAKAKADQEAADAAAKAKAEQEAADAAAKAKK
jgi:hypothetical protein